MTLPLVELRLAESEMAQQCPACERFELPGGEERFKRCGKCKKRYYVRRSTLLQRRNKGANPHSRSAPPRRVPIPSEARPVERGLTSSQCQLEDWKDHKIDCRDLAAGRLAQVENRKRKQTEDYMSGLGFQSA